MKIGITGKKKKTGTKEEAVTPKSEENLELVTLENEKDWEMVEVRIK